MNRELQEKLCIAYADSILTARLLKGDCKIHGFMSGGGLRVLAIQSLVGKKDIAYGEHVTYSQALGVLTEDLARGGISYCQMYRVHGEPGLRPHYYTGQSTPEPGLDEQIRRGNSFDALASMGKIVVQLSGYGGDEDSEGCY